MERRELVRGTHLLERGEARTSQNMERKHAIEGTHFLGRGRVGVRTGQGMERMQASKGYSLPGDPRQRDESEHGKNANQ